MCGKVLQKVSALFGCLHYKERGDYGGNMELTETLRFDIDAVSQRLMEELYSLLAALPIAATYPRRCTLLPPEWGH